MGAGRQESRLPGKLHGGAWAAAQAAPIKPPSNRRELKSIDLCGHQACASFAGIKSRIGRALVLKCELRCMTIAGTSAHTPACVYGNLGSFH
jgi:hypothetical protein